MKSFKSITSGLCVLSILTGCSVYEASRNEGVSHAEIEACKTKSCIMDLERVELISTKTTGNKITETYQAKIRKGNATYGRAVAYGAAGIMTMGFSELVTAPLEGIMSEDKYHIFEMTYDQNDRVIHLAMQE